MTFYLFIYFYDCVRFKVFLNVIFTCYYYNYCHQAYLCILCVVTNLNVFAETDYVSWWTPEFPPENGVYYIFLFIIKILV